MNNYYNMNYGWLPRNNMMYPFDNNYQPNLYNPQEGFMKGNMFENLYNPYKNYQPAVLTPKNNQQKKLYEIQAISFAAHDLNLYLDTHPEDQTMSTLLNDYLRKKRELTKSYEEEYGPLTIDSESMDSAYNWIKKWPWEVDNV